MTRPLLLGHRGARSSPLFSENTLASFELSLRHGCDGFEFDVRRSADGELLICHDATTSGIAIENAAAKSLSLPTLEDVLRQFADRAFLDIELKVAGLEAQTREDLRKHPPRNGYLVSSFLPEVLNAMRDLDPSIPLGFLCETPDELLGWRQTSAEWIVPEFDLTNRELIAAVHAAKKSVMVWTVNSPDQMREYAQSGVDAIISDQTELLVHSVR